MDSNIDLTKNKKNYVNNKLHRNLDYGHIELIQLRYE